MNKIKNIVLFKGKKYKIVHTQDIKVSHILDCFFPEKGDEYSYLGYTYYHINSDGLISDVNRVLIDFYKKVDKVARPWWCPKFILRLLNLFGNDNSIVRMRNYRLSNLYNKITKGIRITDCKWKYDSFRIYGSFTKELEKECENTCRIIENLSE